MKMKAFPGRKTMLIGAPLWHSRIVENAKHIACVPDQS